MIVDKDTLLINEATGAYPLNLAAAQRATREFSFGDSVDEEILKLIGLRAVVRTPAPEGQRYREVAPEQIDGVYYQRFEVVVPTEEDIMAELNDLKQQALNRLREVEENDINVGFPHTFNDANGQAVNQHVQVRTEDRVNILGLHEKAKLIPDVSYNFRTYENVNFSLNAADIVNLALTVGIRFESLKEAVWGLKDAIAAATNKDQLPVIPDTLWQ